MIPEPVEGVDYYVKIEAIEEVKMERDAFTGEPFDREAWTKAKLAADGLNDKGEPLRPHEKTRPAGERTLFDYRER